MLAEKETRWWRPWRVWSSAARATSPGGDRRCLRCTIHLFIMYRRHIDCLYQYSVANSQK